MPPVVVNKFLLDRPQSHSTVYVIFTVAFPIQWQNGTVATEIINSTKPNILTLWSFTEKNMLTSGLWHDPGIKIQQPLATGNLAVLSPYFPVQFS